MIRSKAVDMVKAWHGSGWMGPKTFGMLHKINRDAYRTKRKRVKAWCRYYRLYEQGT